MGLTKKQQQQKAKTRPVVNAYRYISKKAYSKKMLMKLSRNVWRKDKILSIYKY